ncbi:MAG: lasso peptide biosynthesis B2 protein [Chloroflexota bacterium]
MTRLYHLWLALLTLPALLFESRRRTLFREMQAFCRNLPAALKGPLPQALQKLTPDVLRIAYSVSDTHYAIRTTVRNLADVAALLDHRSPLGLCLRRSLVRYHFLRREGLPVVLQFGAKFVAGKLDREVTGHAWLTLDGQPYHEADENWRGFVVMFSYPNGSGDSVTSL